MIQKPTYEELEKALSEYKLSEEALRQNEDKYRQLFELESDALFLIENAGGRILEANRAAAKMYGYSHEELLQLCNMDLSAEPESTRQATRNERPIVPVRYHKKKDGTVFPVEITGSHFLWQDRKVHIAAIREIAWRLQAEETLRQSEMRLQDIAASIPGAVYQFLIRPDGTYAVPYMSAGAQNLFERPLAELTNPDLLFVDIHPDDLAALQQSISAAAQQMQRWTQEFRIVKPDGRITWLRGSANPRRVEDGMTLWNGVLLDITERKLGENRIRHLNRVLRVIREVKRLTDRVQDRDTLIGEGCRLLVGRRGYTGAFIVLTDASDRPLSWTQAGMGPSFDPLAAAFAQGALPPCCARVPIEKELLVVDIRETLCSACVLSTRNAKSVSLCVRLAHGGVGYGYLVAEAGSHIEVDEEEQALLAEIAGALAYALSVLQLAQDRKASDRKRLSLETQLLQAQKIESVGRLAGGVAHDYNNMLSVISGFAELALEKVAPGDPLHADLKQILEAAKRSSEITRQLVAFARKQTIAPKVLDLNDTVEGMLKMLRRLIGEDIDLAWMPDAGLWPVKMDPAQIDQILANLCVNARDAISAAGKITIETGNATLDETYCADHAGFIPGEFALLAVSDDGCGMEEELQAKIFEPFFTTKELGKGTGLGLATVYGIVKQNSGFINVYSEPGKGTTFKIYLPRHAAEAKETATACIEQIPAGRGETVLLVEDEPTIIMIAKKMLERLEYRVVAAGTPSEAMRLARQSGGHIDLLLTDVVMPEMNGRELANKLQTMHPEIKILFMSGYTSNVIAHQGVLDAGVNFIQKPLALKELALKIRAIMDKIKT